ASTGEQSNGVKTWGRQKGFFCTNSPPCRVNRTVCVCVCWNCPTKSVCNAKKFKFRVQRLSVCISCEGFFTLTAANLCFTTAGFLPPCDGGVCLCLCASANIGISARTCVFVHSCEKRQEATSGRR
uniref:Uncharacterized protein n=1 Tax=Anopheles coluzzii TaxID=1518534 RepID=A0A6E8VZB5_ANOCL